jgi:hypothetical protein
MWVTSNVDGDITPGLKGDASPKKKLKKPGWFDAFWDGRRWDWDNIAREVGWKVGGLLLITTAWLFWGIETGRYS